MINLLRRLPPEICFMTRKVSIGVPRRKSWMKQGTSVKSARLSREKDLSEEEYYEIAEKCKEICDRNGASLTIHNFIDVARRLGIKKIHLPYPVFLKEAGNLSDFESVSTSIHKPEEAIKAQKLGVDFVFAGHVFVTDCKKGLPPRGLEFLTDVVNAVKIPVYGIGGINEENITKIMECGAAGGCMMSGFMK